MTTFTDSPLEHSPWKAEWELAEGVTYLNHGSFGPSPLVVRKTEQQWTDQLERQPMQFLMREMEPEFRKAYARLAQFLKTKADHLLFVENATVGMNLVPEALDLQPGDEVLLTDHEYGAVQRIWRDACSRTGARMVTHSLPAPLTSAEETVAQLFEGVTPRTRILVVSHVTSPTGMILPVREICREAKARGIPVCIDGPHAPAMIDVDLGSLGCDFYAASCHKWLSAPFGSGFLYVHSRWKPKLKPRNVSWGRSLTPQQKHWRDEFGWQGTRNPSAYLSIPAAISFLESVGLETVRNYMHTLAQEARLRIEELTGLPALYPDDPAWYGSMATVPLPPLTWEADPPSEPDPLQVALWEQYQIEVPILHWNGHRLIRVSCHLYNDRRDLDHLMNGLQELLPQFSD